MVWRLAGASRTAKKAVRRGSLAFALQAARPGGAVDPGDLGLAEHSLQAAASGAVGGSMPSVSFSGARSRRRSIAVMQSKAPGALLLYHRCSVLAYCDASSENCLVLLKNSHVCATLK